MFDCVGNKLIDEETKGSRPREQRLSRRPVKEERARLSARRGRKSSSQAPVCVHDRNGCNFHDAYGELVKL
jgi:hypothetical protein